MPEPAPLAAPGDVADIWRPLTSQETTQVTNLIAKVSAKLRQKCPWDLDARIALYTSTPTDPTALDPLIVADVVATVVKRLLVNPQGVASSADGVGPFSHSATFVNRYDKTGSDVRGAIQITESDIDQLRPAVPSPQMPFSFKTGVPRPQILVPARRINGASPLGIAEPVIIPDLAPDTGVE